jgi:hypothetical protein
MSETETVEQNEVSTKRTVAATVASVATQVVLGVVSTLLIGKISNKVHETIENK